MKFEPQSYKVSVGLSLIGILVSLLSLLAGLFFWYRESKAEVKPAA